MNIKLACPDRWQGDLTEDMKRSIVQGLLIPSPEMSRRLAWELLETWKTTDHFGEQHKMVKKEVCDDK